ncbi:MAG: ATP-binding cassette domain-containing protein [Pseudonocardiaceae bacterium]|nr:ATP-binding cassette domain-containing protein [Pseudonocardiaceae bacterium]
MSATASSEGGSVPATPLLDVTELDVRIGTPRGVVHAVNGVSLDLDRGETLGIVGESGSGKSMFVRALMGILPSGATLNGSVLFDGIDLTAVPVGQAREVWGRRIGMVFQDPMTSLNPVVRIGRQISESARIHLGLNRRRAEELEVELLGQVGIPEPERRRRDYPHQFSGGMRQRVTIAMALACEPDLLIADEATTALDVTVQKQILNLLQRIQRERNMAMILVSHDLGVVAGRTDRIAVMYAGRVVERAPTPLLFERRRHRYTDALLGAIPRLDHPPHARLRSISGTPPDMATLGSGCAFAPRCPAADDRCRTEDPPSASESAVAPQPTGSAVSEVSAESLEASESAGGHVYHCFHPVAASVPTAPRAADTSEVPG